MIEAKIDVVSAPLWVLEPKDIFLLITKCLKALSALLLSIGMLGDFRNVKYFCLFFRSDVFNLESGVGSKLWLSDI